MAAVNWTCEEVFKLISIWSDATIQEQLEGCRRNSQVYKKISDDLRTAGFARTLEQCREKIKKLKTEYKKIKYKRDETGQGRYPEWEYFDALNEVLGHKHSTEPPVVVESLSMTTDEVTPDDETQDMSGVGESDATNVPSPAVSSTGSSSITSVARPSTDTEETSRETQPPDSKSRKCKRGKLEGTNALLEKMVKLQENSDKMLCMLEEKRAKMEERQMELDAQLRREEREFQIQMLQILTQQNTPRHLPPPPVPHYGLHSSFNFGGAEYDPDATQEGL